MVVVQQDKLRNSRIPSKPCNEKTPRSMKRASNRWKMATIASTGKEDKVVAMEQAYEIMMTAVKDAVDEEKDDELVPSHFRDKINAATRVYE